MKEYIQWGFDRNVKCREGKTKWVAAKSMPATATPYFRKIVTNGNWSREQSGTAAKGPIKWDGKNPRTFEAMKSLVNLSIQGAN